MAYQDLNIGSSANDGNGDTLRAGGTKIKANFGEIYARFGSGSSDGATLETATSANLLVGNGTKFASVPSSGDFNISSAGAINVRTTGAVSKITIPSGSAPGSTANTLYNIGGALYFNGAVVGSGNVTGMTAFSVTGDSGSAQSIAQGNTVTIAGGTGLASVASATDTITLNIDATVATLTGTQVFTNKTLTSAVLNTGVSGTAIKDEDNMSSDSATHLATQQSIKAYVDAQIATENTIDEMNDTTITSAADGHFLVHTGSAWVNEAPATARTSLGLGTIATAAAPSGTVVGTTDTQTLSGKTLTAPKIADAGFIADANGAEQIIFQTTASAVNEIEVTNSATGGSAVAATSTAPIIGASGETNVDLALLPKGTGITTIRSTGGSNNQGMIRLNCENNTHGQTVMSQPHSVADSSFFMLPKGSSAGNARATPDVLLSGDKTVGTVQALSGAGACSLDTLITEVTSTGAEAITLANGVAGQMKIITMVVDGGDSTLTPATFSDGTTAVFGDAGDSLVLVYHNTIGWKAVVNNGTTIS